MKKLLQVNYFHFENLPPLLWFGNKITEYFYKKCCAWLWWNRSCLPVTSLHRWCAADHCESDWSSLWCGQTRSRRALKQTGTIHLHSNITNSHPSSSWNLTCALQESSQKLGKWVRLREEVGHSVKVIEGHDHIFGVSAHIDDLWDDISFDLLPVRFISTMIFFWGGCVIFQTFSLYSRCLVKVLH